jgi:hypothetical protein
VDDDPATLIRAAARPVHVTQVHPDPAESPRELPQGAPEPPLDVLTQRLTDTQPATADLNAHDVLL